MPSTFFSPKRKLALFSFVPAVVLLFGLQANAGRSFSSDPWSQTQIIQPTDLIRELTNKTSPPLIVVYVGPRTLFLGSHIPGATFHGTTSTEAGLDEFKKWASTVPRDSNLVIYCGCCPFEKCPNIRPAFTALRDLNFTHVRVLALATSFKSDWIDKNYPTEKGL